MTPGLNYRAFTFINEEYLEKGRALYGRQTPELLQDFRKAIGTVLDDADDDETYAIIQFAVQRVRMIRNIYSLRAARYKYARVVDTMDSKTFSICALMRDKCFRVRIAALNLETFSQLSIEEQASILNRACNRAMDKDFPRSFAFEGRVIPDFLIWEGLGTPPFHRLCTCSADGIDKEEIDGPPEPPRRSVNLKVTVTRE